MSTSSPSEGVVPLAERSQTFLHAARGLRGLSPHQIARIARRLEGPRPARQRRVLVRAVAAAALALTLGTAAAWASGALGRLPGFGALLGWRQGPPPAAAVPGSAAEPAASTAAAAEPEFGALPGALPEPSGPMPEGVTAQQPRRSAPRPAAHRRASVAAPRPEAPPAERSDSLIVLEGRSFARALELWRARRDAPAALAALDEHERRYAGGQMRAEALVLRAEILLAGRHEREALAALDQVSLDRVPRGRELRTLRGELRVRFGRCEEGRADLAPVARGADAHAARAREALVRCP